MLNKTSKQNVLAESLFSSSRQVNDIRLHKKRSGICLQNGGVVKVEVVIGTPLRGPYHLALRHANPGTLFTGVLQHDDWQLCPCNFISVYVGSIMKVVLSPCTA